MTYADGLRLHIGHEYLERAYQFIGNPALGNMTVRIYGDSTTCMGPSATDPNRPRHSVNEIIRHALWDAGVSNFNIVNHGNPGDRWDTFINPIPHLADGTTGLMLIKLGINDAGLGTNYASAIDILHYNMGARLTAIRNAPNGDLTKLSIILVGPNSTNDVPGRRDTTWYELVRPVYVEMARKHRCAYFDSYGHMQDARPPAAGFYLDDPYNDGVRGIHPSGYFNHRLWGAMIGEFFPRGAVAVMSQSPSAAVALLEGWKNMGGLWAPVRASRMRDIVSVDGMMCGGTTSPGTIWGRMPEGFRSNHKHQFVTLGQTGIVGIHMEPSGWLAFQTAAHATSTAVSFNFRIC